MVPPPPHINYVASYPMPAPTNEVQPFTFFSTYFVLDPVGDMVYHLLWELELDILIRSLDMYPFQSDVLPSDENLLKAMASWRS